MKIPFRGIQAFCVVIVIYVIIGGFVGIELKNSYPPFHLCEYAYHPQLDPYCASADILSSPALDLLAAPAVLAGMIFHVDIGDFILLPYILIAATPIALLIYGSLLYYRGRYELVVYAMLFFVLAEIIWYGVTGVYGIT